MKRKIERCESSWELRNTLGWMNSYGEVTMAEADECSPIMPMDDDDREFPVVRYFTIPAYEGTEDETDDGMVAVVAEQVGVFYFDRDLGCSSGITESYYINGDEVDFPWTLDDLAEMTEESVIGLFKRYGHDCSIR